MNWNWSFRLARILETEVRIHWTLPAVFLFFVLRSFQYGASIVFVGLFVVLPWLLLFGSVLLHEFGHVLAARSRWLEASRIVLTPIGGAAFVGQARTARDEFFVAVCGPLVNVALAAAGLGLYGALGGPLRYEVVVPFAGERLFAELWWSGRLGVLLVHEFVQMQIFLVLFNVLLVAYPMDGGRMLFAFLWRRMGWRPALDRSCRVARVLAIGMGIVGLLLFNLFLVVIAVLVWLQAASVLRQLPALADPGAGYDPRLEKLLHEQREGRGGPPPRPGEGRFARWLRRRRNRKVDALLTRIRRDGIASLTEREREFLRRARERAEGGG